MRILTLSTASFDNNHFGEHCLNSTVKANVHVENAHNKSCTPIDSHHFVQPFPSLSIKSCPDIGSRYCILDANEEQSVVHRPQKVAPL